MRNILNIPDGNGCNQNKGHPQNLSIEGKNRGNLESGSAQPSLLVYLVILLVY